MTDLETRLTEALRHGADDAPAAVGLAAAARTRARQRRRRHLAGAAALVVLAVGVPTAVVTARGDDPADRNKGTDPVPNGVPDGYRVESWHSVTVLVPDTWKYGALSQWCVSGDLDTPLVDRPGVSTLMLCSPASGYGVSFAPAEGHEVQWPLAPQHSDSWPDGAYVGATTVKDVVVTVALPDAAVATQVLGSVQEIVGGDANGCGAKVWALPVVDDGTMSVCRYDANGDLEQSEQLEGGDVDAAYSALESAPSGPADCTQQPGYSPSTVVTMRTAQVGATVHLSDTCSIITDLDKPREVTGDVLYWALSPGWSGGVSGDVPLPKELRQ